MGRFPSWKSPGKQPFLKKKGIKRFLDQAAGPVVRGKCPLDFPFIWESEMVAANRVAAINSPVNDTDPTRKSSIDPGSLMDLQNPAEVSPKGKPIWNFSIDPTSLIWTRLRTPLHFPPKLHRKLYRQTSLRGSGLWRALKIKALRGTVASKGVFEI